MFGFLLRVKWDFNTRKSRWQVWVSEAASVPSKGSTKTHCLFVLFYWANMDVSAVPISLNRGHLRRRRMSRCCFVLSMKFSCGLCCLSPIFSSVTIGGKNVLCVRWWHLLALCIQIDNVKVRLCRYRGVAGTTGTRHGREQVDQMVKVNSQTAVSPTQPVICGRMGQWQQAQMQWFNTSV